LHHEKTHYKKGVQRLFDKQEEFQKLISIEEQGIRLNKVDHYDNQNF